MQENRNREAPGESRALFFGTQRFNGADDVALSSGKAAIHGQRKSRKLDVGRERMGFREDFAALAEILEMAGDGVMDFSFDFGTSPGSGDAPGQVRRVGGVARSGFFNDDQIFLHDAGKASQTSDSVEER
jgi:hypothetical protein